MTGELPTSVLYLRKEVEVKYPITGQLV